MSIQLNQFYRYSCYRGLGDPTHARWRTGETATITITPGSNMTVFVTEALLLVADGWELDTVSGDAMRITPWGYTAPYQVDLMGFNMIYAHCRSVEPAGVIVDGDQYHYLQMKFRPFIKVSDAEGTAFTLENTGGAYAVINGGVAAHITVFSYTVATADE